MAGALQQAEENASIERDGTILVLTVPAERLGNVSGPVELGVSVPAANTSTTATATPDGDRYVARLQVRSLVGPDVEADLAATEVVVRHDGEQVLAGTGDLRLVVATAPPVFSGTTLVLAADVRGVTAPNLTLATNRTTLMANRTGVGPNATLTVRASELDGVPAGREVRFRPRTEAGPIPGPPMRVQLAEASRAATALEIRDGEPVIVQPLVHPSIGPDPVELAVETEGPAAVYRTRGSATDAATPIAPSILTADGHRVTVVGANGTALLEDVSVRPPSRDRVPLRIANGSLSTPEPSALAGYDAVLLRTDDGVAHLAITDALRTEGRQPLPRALAETQTGASAILIGSSVRPARASLTVVPPETDDGGGGGETDAPDGEGFVGVWLNVGAIVVLLVLAMVGAIGTVAGAYGVRTLSPARHAAAGPRAVAGHFLLGGIGGTIAITLVQRATVGPVLGAISIAGVEVGLGALLVGGFIGGITATGLRLGLGTTGTWPTRTVIDETTVPVRIRITDDEGQALPGEATVEARRGDGTVAARATIAGTTSEIELPAGEYELVGQFAERETDGTSLAIAEPSTPQPEARSVHLQLGRPALELEVTAAATGEPVPRGSVTFTTDEGQTRAAEIEEGRVRTRLPIGAGTVSAVVDAPGFDELTREITVDTALSTVEIALEPATGTLRVTALCGGAAIPDARVLVEPAEGDAGDDTERTTAADAAGGAGGDDAADAEEGATPAEAALGDELAGERSTELVTDEDGTATVEVPVGEYVAHLELEGPNAELFAVADATATVTADAEATATVRARFEWSLADAHRRRSAGLRKTIRSVAAEAKGDPTVPLYFAGVTAALLDCAESLPDAGHRFATGGLDPDDVAGATVAAAEAALEAVGQAMQAEGVRPVLARGGEPERVEPPIEADPAALLDYLEQDLTVASVERRAEEVRATVAEHEAGLTTTVPLEAVIAKGVALPEGAADPLAVATREFAALRLLDAVEAAVSTGPIRERLT